MLNFCKLKNHPTKSRFLHLLESMAYGFCRCFLSSKGPRDYLHGEWDWSNPRGFWPGGTCVWSSRVRMSDCLFLFSQGFVFFPSVRKVLRWLGACNWGSRGCCCHHWFHVRPVEVPKVATSKGNTDLVTFALPREMRLIVQSDTLSKGINEQSNGWGVDTWLETCSDSRAQSSLQIKSINVYLLKGFGIINYDWWLFPQRSKIKEHIRRVNKEKGKRRILKFPMERSGTKCKWFPVCLSSKVTWRVQRSCREPTKFCTTGLFSCCALCTLVCFYLLKT